MKAVLEYNVFYLVLSLPGNCPLVAVKMTALQKPKT